MKGSWHLRRHWHLERPGLPTEMHTIDGAAPAEVLQATVEWLGRNPSHPGRDIADTCERKSLSIATAAAHFKIKRAASTAVTEGRVAVLDR